MPRNGSGVYSQPANTAAVSGETISSTGFNSLVTDIGDEITASLPRNGSAAMTGALILPDGSTGSLAVKFTNDTDTGIYRVGTNDFAFQAGGTVIARFRLNGSTPEIVNAGATEVVLFGSAATTAFIKTLLDDADAATARATLAAAGSATTITAGSGLTGGGDLSANRTLALDITGLTADTAPDRFADYVPTYDASGTANKKVLAHLVAPGAPDILLEEKPTSGTAATAISSSYTKRVIDTETRDTPSAASISSGAFTLTAGTYYCEAWASIYNSNVSVGVTDSRLRLRNTTDGTTTLSSDNVPLYLYPSYGRHVLSGTFTIAGTKTFELQQRAASGTVTGGLAQSESSVNELFAQVKFWKIG